MIQRCLHSSLDGSVLSAAGMHPWQNGQVVCEQAQISLQLIVENVIDVNNEQQRCEHSSLRDARSGSKPVGAAFILHDSEAPAPQEASDECKAPACDASTSQFEEQFVVRNSVKCLSDVQKRYGNEWFNTVAYK